MQNYSYNLVGWNPSARDEGVLITLRVPLHVNDKIWLPHVLVKVEEIIHEIHIREDSFGTKHYEDSFDPFVRVRII